MIRIQEKDLLWKWYKRATSEPDPKTLCNYFWTAMGGLCLIILYDLSFKFTALILGSLLSVLIYWDCTTNVWHERGFWDATESVFLTVSTLVVAFLAFGVTIDRWLKYWESKSETVTETSKIIFIWVISSLIISGLFVDRNDTKWHWWYLFYSMGLEVLFVAAVLAVMLLYFVFFSNGTNIGKNTRQYLKAVKDRVCPLVVPPKKGEENDQDPGK